MESFADIEPRQYLDENRRDAADFLGARHRTSFYATWVGAAFFLIGGLIVQSLWGFVLGVLVAVVNAARFPAFAAYRRGDVQRGLLITIAGTWLVAIPVVAIVPEGFPIMVINVIGPQILAAAFLERHVVRRFVIGGVLLSILLGVLYALPGAGLDRFVAGWFFDAVIIVYLAAHVLLVTLDVEEAAAVRFRMSDRISAANRELESAGEALRESRRRLVATADAERVRIERNIHDGAQQRLVSLAVHLNLAAQLADEGTPPSAELLRELHGATLETVEELRELAQGIYPALLAERGLAEALRGAARRSPQIVTVAMDGAAELDADAEVAIYFVCLEAIQNAAKHAGVDTTVQIDISHADDHLVVRIVDDGPGFDPDRHVGSRGLANMSDRVAALGGEFVLDGAPGEGTAVRATVPLPTRSTGGAE